MDDNTKPLEEEEVVEEQLTQEAPPVEQEEQAQEENSQEELGSEEEEEPEPAPPSRREQLRVQELLKKYGPPQRTAPSGKGPDFRSRVNADEDTYKEIEDTARGYAQEQYTEGVKQAEYQTWKRFLQNDERDIRNRFDALNPGKKDQYYPALEKSLQTKYLRSVGYDPGDPERGIAPSVMYSDLSYADFVESEMEFAQEMATSMTTTTARNIAKQASRGGLRPDGTPPKRMNLNKPAEDMSDDELKAAISASMPRDNRGRFTQSK